MNNKKYLLKTTSLLISGLVFISLLTACKSQTNFSEETNSRLMIEEPSTIKKITENESEIFETSFITEGSETARDTAQTETEQDTSIPTEENKNVPILMYHTSSEASPGGLTELFVKPSEFDLQLKTLSENGYTFCTFDDMENINKIKKPIMLTFDDGYLENYTEIFPIVKKYNAKITIFLIISSISPSGLTEEMIKEMSDSGLVKFESHTLSHPSLISASSNPALLEKEIQDSKIKIEAITGKTVLALSYPNGEFNEKVKECTAKYYKYGVRKDLGLHNTSYDNFEVRRLRVNRSTSIENYMNMVSEG